MQKFVTLLTAAVVAIGSNSPSFAAVKDFTSVASDSPQTIIEKRRPRVPGSSGCDSPRDLIRHPECQV